jgi:hypothetical protein
VKDAYIVGTKDDFETQERIWYLSSAFPIPDWASLIAGDAVHCLRCALDHIIYRLVWVCTQGHGPFKNLYFPLGSDGAKFSKRLKEASEHKAPSGGIVQRLRPDAIKAIEALEPYEGGRNAILWHIHSLDIIDKHNLLLTVGLTNPTHTMTPEMIAGYKNSLRIKNEYTPLEESWIFQTDSKAIFPLNAGDELARIPIAKANENMQFPFTIAFGEPKVIEGKAITPFLFQAAGFIRGIIRDFEELGILS